MKKPPPRGRAPAAKYPGHDAPGGPFDRQPQPYFALALADKGPHFIQFQYRLFRLTRLRSNRLWFNYFRLNYFRINYFRCDFFIYRAIVMRATPVTRTTLRCELRSTKNLSTCAY